MFTAGTKLRPLPGRPAVAVVLLWVLLAVSPTALALTPGPTVVLQCPGCTNALHQFTIGSGNTIGAKFWTDGFMRAPMLPMLPALVKCPHCKKLFWLEDARELARIDIWSRAGKWQHTREPLEPVEADYLAATAAANLSRSRELYARRRAWWLANDPARDDPSRKVDWTEPRRKNLARLSALLDEAKDDELIRKAEIARELQQFDSCLKLLSRPVGKERADTANLVARLAQEKRAQVEREP